MSQLKLMTENHGARAVNLKQWNGEEWVRCIGKRQTEDDLEEFTFDGIIEDFEEGYEDGNWLIPNGWQAYNTGPIANVIDLSNMYVVSGKKSLYLRTITGVILVEKVFDFNDYDLLTVHIKHTCNHDGSAGRGLMLLGGEPLKDIDGNYSEYVNTEGYFHYDVSNITSLGVITFNVANSGQGKVDEMWVDFLTLKKT